jgi:amino acid transporter
LAGAAKCILFDLKSICFDLILIKLLIIGFYAFVGFDCIATTGEEVITFNSNFFNSLSSFYFHFKKVNNPQRAIPIGIIVSLVICTIYYSCASAVLSLMIPYYLIDPNAPLPEAFRFIGYEWGRYIVAIGAVSFVYLFFDLFSYFNLIFSVLRFVVCQLGD